MLIEKETLTVKKVCAILLTTILLFGVISVAYASHYSHEYMLCTSSECNGNYRPHNCVNESYFDEEVECPDAVANCVCIRRRITHQFVCSACLNSVYTVTYTYLHSK